MSRVRVQAGKPSAPPRTRTEAAQQFTRKKARQRSRLLRRRSGLLAALLVGTSLAASGWWLTREGKMDAVAQHMSSALWNATASLGFRIDQVYVAGRSHAPLEAVRQASAVAPASPTLGVNLAEVKARLEAIPEVQHAEVSRQLPSHIRVHITERVPAVFWQHEGKHVLMDREGIVLNAERYTLKKPLMVVVGSDAPKQVKALTELLASAPKMASEVVAAVRVGERRWNVQLRNDVTVMLPEQGAPAAWKRFASLAQKEALLTRAIRTVDMRLEDRVFITPLDQPNAPITLTGAKET